jgi:hypothetical protein
MSLIKTKLAALVKILDPTGELMPQEAPQEVQETAAPTETTESTETLSVAEAPPQEPAVVEPVEEPTPEPEPAPEPEPVVEEPVATVEPEVEPEPTPEPDPVVVDDFVEPAPAPRMALRMMAAPHRALRATPSASPLTSSLQSLQTAMTDFVAPYNSALVNTKVQEALTADNAAELSDATPAEVITALEADLDAHAATYGQSHNVTPLQAGTYSKTQVDSQLQGRVAFSGMPLTRYGELSYLPAGVSGSFEGATTNIAIYGEARNYPGIVEDDGTFVFLRSGTNGSKQGVYYAYTKNVLAATDLTPTRTNRKYAPAYFPSGSSARYVCRSDINGACILGRLQDASNNLTDWFLSLTHGTFNDANHTGCVISASNLPGVINNAYPEAFVGNDSVFLIFPTADLADNTGLPVEYQIYQIPLSSIGNGNTVVPTALTGWTINSFYGQNISTTNMRFANACVDVAANQPLVIRDPSANGCYIVPFYPNQLGHCTYSAQGSDGNVRTRIMVEFLVQNPATGEQPVVNMFYTFVWNPTNRTGGVESAYKGPLTVAVNGSNKVALSGPILLADRSSISSGNWLTGETLSYHPSGYWVSVVDQNQPDLNCWVTRCKLNAGATAPVVALAGGLTVTGKLNTVFTPAYGSAVGGGLLGSFQLPSNRVLVYGGGKNAAGSFQTDLILAQKGADGYTYSSQNFGTLTGFAPNAYRQFVTDLGKNPVSYAGMISEITAAGAITCTGASYMENISNTGFTNCDSNLTLTGNTSIAPALYGSIKSAMLSALGVGAVDSRVTIVVPQNASIPPFAVLNWISTDAVARDMAALGELSITAGSRAGAITGLSLVSVSPAKQNYSFAGAFTDNQNNYKYTYMGGGVTIVECSDCWLIGGTSKHFLNRVIFTGIYTYRFAVPKSTNRPDWNRLVTNPVWGQIASVFWGGVPGKGFGEFQQLVTNSDDLTKLTFRPFATNLSTYDAWTQSAQANWSVQVSQDVAQGWIVYFTDIQPLIMNGVYYKLQPATIDLTTIQANPASTTFYIYVVFTNGTPAYVIRTTDQPESPTVLFIGTLVTNATQISAINMQKVTRLGNYRVSATRAGAAIPVSSGTPDAAAVLAWK